MLRAVYEENRGIAEDDRHSGRKRWTVGIVGYLAVAAVLVAVAITGRSSDRSDRAGATAGSPTTILGAELPIVDTAPAPEDWIAEDEYAALLNQDTPLAELFDLQIRTIVLDPGHGGVDPGAVGAAGTLEKDVALDVARRLSRRLGTHGYRVLLTREDDRTMTLRERVEFANEQPTDLFVSIHVNDFPADSVNAVETYYFGANTETRSLRVAEKENRGADYSVADFNGMIRRVGATVKLQESRVLAKAIQRALYGNKRRLAVPVSDWGAKSGPFVVLLGSQAPSVLAEIGVLSHPADERRLVEEAHREQLAMFLEEGILTYLISRTRTESGTELAQ